MKIHRSKPNGLRISKRNGKYTATAYIPSGYPHPVKAKSFTKTFSKLRDARSWGEYMRVGIATGVWHDPRLNNSEFATSQITLLAALEKYLKDVTPQKKGYKQEASLIKRLMKTDLAGQLVSSVSKSDIASYRDQRIKAGRSGSTIQNELNMISALYETASHDWGIDDLVNPVRALKKRRGAVPSRGAGRERRLEAGEESRMLSELAKESMAEDMLALFHVAVGTGMRLSEMLSIKKSWINGDIIHIPDTKSGKPRTVLMSPDAIKAIKEMKVVRWDGGVFNLNTDQVEYRWRRARSRAVVDDLCYDLRFHDLRHEALSRLSSRGAGLKVMMRQSGHSTPTMLMRYINPTDEDVRKYVA